MSEKNEELAAAEAAVAKAEAAVSKAEAALVAGTGAAGTLVAAEQRAEEKRTVRDRLAAALTRRSELAAEAARKGRIAELEELLLTQSGRHEAGICEAHDAAVDALAVLIGRLVEHDTALLAVTRELQGLGELPATIQASSEGQVHLPGPDIFFTRLGAARLVDEAVARAAIRVGYREEGLSGRGGVRSEPAPSKVVAGPSDRLRRTAALVAERDASGGAPIDQPNITKEAS